MFRIIGRNQKSRARVGRLETKHGSIKTPAFIVVGTEAEVRAIRPEDLGKTKTQIIIANAFHLWQKLGDQGLKKYPGLHKAMAWDGPLMTDSGGFQVFSLGYGREFDIGKVAKAEMIKAEPVRNLVEVTDQGVYFKIGKQKEYLDAERSIVIQEQLGADIILAFDEPSSPYHSYSYTEKAMERTHLWAERSLKAKKTDQQLFGIIQGGIYEKLRRASAKFISSLEFDGFAIGGAFGSSFGSKKEDTFHELDWVIPYLPDNKPRHLLGIGRVEDLFRGVEAGIDLFDCVVPTREARHGSIWTHQGRIDIKKGRFKNDERVIDPECSCPVCAGKKLNRKELRTLFKNKNHIAGRLATIHNLYFFNNLMEEIRRAVTNGNLKELRDRYLNAEID